MLSVASCIAFTARAIAVNAHFVSLKLYPPQSIWRFIPLGIIGKYLRRKAWKWIWREHESRAGQPERNGGS
jgi:hypothetical protein